VISDIEYSAKLSIQRCDPHHGKFQLVQFLAQLTTFLAGSFGSNA
jgi:hypothetical protein